MSPSMCVSFICSSLWAMARAGRRVEEAAASAAAARGTGCNSTSSPASSGWSRLLRELRQLARADIVRHIESSDASC